MIKISRKFFGYSVYTKGNTYIIPTVSYNEENKIPIANIVPNHFNLTKSMFYTKRVTSTGILNNNIVSSEENIPLLKILVDVSPNYEEFYEFVKEKSKNNIIYLNVLSQHYLYLAELIKNTENFPNLIITIENSKLTETELIGIYEDIKMPLDLGINSKNLVNFQESATETSIRRYFKEMFKFNNQLKIIELDFADLNLLCRPVKHIKKSADINTLIDFTLMAEFKGFLDISLNEIEYNHTMLEQQNLSENLNLIDKLFVDKGFHYHQLKDKLEILHLLNNLRPQNDQFVTSTF